MADSRFGWLRHSSVCWWQAHIAAQQFRQQRVAQGGEGNGLNELSGRKYEFNISHGLRGAERMCAGAASVEGLRLGLGFWRLRLGKR